jgi:hypothetical protein
MASVFDKLIAALAAKQYWYVTRFRSDRDSFERDRECDAERLG